MITFINNISKIWGQFFVPWGLQNIVFLAIIFGILYWYRNHNARFLRFVALIGLAKLFIPPFLRIPRFSTAVANTAVEIQKLNLSNYVVYREAVVKLSALSWGMLLWVTIMCGALSYILYHIVKSLVQLKSFRKINIAPELISDFNDMDVKFYQTDFEHSPFISGFLRKRVVLPKIWDNFSDEDKKTILTHELNHFRNGDNWINLCGLLAKSLHFFNPLVWLLCSRINDLNEKVCDDSTIFELRTDSIRYSKDLLNISSHVSNKIVFNSNEMMFSKTHKKLKSRLAYLLSRKEQHTMNLVKNRCILLCLLGFIFLFSWNVTEAKPNEKESDEVTVEVLTDGEIISKDIIIQLIPDAIEDEDLKIIVDGVEVDAKEMNDGKYIVVKGDGSEEDKEIIIKASKVDMEIDGKKTKLSDLKLDFLKDIKIEEDGESVIIKISKSDEKNNLVDDKELQKIIEEALANSDDSYEISKDIVVVSGDKHVFSKVAGEDLAKELEEIRINLKEIGLDLSNLDEEDFNCSSYKMYIVDDDGKVNTIEGSEDDVAFFVESAADGSSDLIVKIDTLQVIKEYSLTIDDDDNSKYKADLDLLIENLVKPKFPKEAIKTVTKGNVTVEVTIDKKGHLKNTKVIESSNKVFNDAALDAIKKSTFKPQKSEVTFHVPFDFHIK